MRPYLLGVLVAVFYAGNILTGRALNELPPMTIAFVRLLIAFVVMLPLGYRSAWRSREVFRRHPGPVLFLSLTGVTAFNALIYTALRFTSATNVSVLEAAIPALTAVLGAWLLRERLRRLQWAGVALSLLGSVWVVLDGRVLQLATTSWNRGDVIMIGAVVCWAAYSIGVKRYLHLFPDYGAVLVMTGVSVLVLLPFVAVEWLVAGVPDLTAGPYWWGLLYLGIFPSVVALVCYNRVVAALGASRASVFLNLLPVLTMAGGYALLNEVITAPQVLGAALVICGVFLTVRGGARARTRPPAR